MNDFFLSSSWNEKLIVENKTRTLFIVQSWNTPQQHNCHTPNEVRRTTMKQDITKQSSIWNAPPKKIFLICLLVGVVTFNIMVGYNAVNHPLDSSTNKASTNVFKSSSGSINSAAGTTFENKRIRTFKHHEQHKQSNFGLGENENMNMPTIPSMTKNCKRWEVVTTTLHPSESLTSIF